MQRRDTQTEDTRTWKIVVLALIIGIIGGLIGGALTGPLFAQPGPQGAVGDTGPKGDTGAQGPQGIQGIDGADGILQILQHRNDTAVNTAPPYYAGSQWFNMSDFDASMKMTISIQQDSMIFAQFSGTQTVGDASIKVRIVIDYHYNSSIYQVSVPAPPASGIDTIPGHIEFLTDPLTAGQHTIEVQFQTMPGNSPTIQILDRTLTLTEITTP